jgi:hypothetical protein
MSTDTRTRPGLSGLDGFFRITERGRPWAARCAVASRETVGIVSPGNELG